MIPARWESSRFPGKPLFELLGKPLLQHVVERARQCQELTDLLVATDDQRIADLCGKIDVPVTMTRSDHPSGTDRIAEAVAARADATHVINIQGDEPLLDPALVDSLALTLRQDSDVAMITAATPIKHEAFLTDPNVVKVVLDTAYNALYFSRSPIPYRRGGVPSLPTYRHLGIYGYRCDTLQTLVELPPSQLEQAEGLEQLRALEQGISIRVQLTNDEAIGLDSPDQVAHIESLLRAEEG